MKKCPSDFKLPALYVIDSLIRKSQQQYDTKEDIFTLRFVKIFPSILQSLNEISNFEDTNRVLKVLHLWEQKELFDPEICRLAKECIFERSEANYKLLTAKVEDYLSTKDLNALYLENVIGRRSLGQNLNTHQSSPSHASNLSRPEINFADIDKMTSEFTHLLNFVSHYVESLDGADIGKMYPSYKTLENLYTYIQKMALSLYEKKHLTIIRMDCYNKLQQVQKMINEHLPPEPPMPPCPTDDSKNVKQSDCSSHQPPLPEDLPDPFPEIVSTSYEAKDNSDKQIFNPYSSAKYDFDKNLVANQSKPSQQKKSTESNQEFTPPISKDCPEFAPFTQPNCVTVFSDTVWLGKLPKNLQTEKSIASELADFGEILHLTALPSRGCAFVQMYQRKDADNIIQNFTSSNNQFHSLKISWSLPNDFQELFDKQETAQLRKFWREKLGIFLIPWPEFSEELFDKLKSCNALVLNCTLPKQFLTVVSKNDWSQDFNMKKQLGVSSTSKSNAKKSSKRDSTGRRDKFESGRGSSSHNRQRSEHCGAHPDSFKENSSFAGRTGSKNLSTSRSLSPTCRNERLSKQDVALGNKRSKLSNSCHAHDQQSSSEKISRSKLCESQNNLSPKQTKFSPTKPSNSQSKDDLNEINPIQQKFNANFSSELAKVEKPLESFSPHPSMPNFGLINRPNSQPNSQACTDNENNKKLAAVEGSEYTPVDVILTKHLQNYQGRKNILKPSSDRPLDRMKSNIFLQGQGKNSSIDFKNHADLANFVFDNERLIESLKGSYGNIVSDQIEGQDLSEVILSNVNDYMTQISNSDRLNFSTTQKNNSQDNSGIKITQTPVQNTPMGYPKPPPKKNLMAQSQMKYKQELLNNLVSSNAVKLAPSLSEVLPPPPPSHKGDSFTPGWL